MRLFHVEQTEFFEYTGVFFAFLMELQPVSVCFIK